MAQSPNLPEGYRLIPLDTIDSTNSEALRRMNSGALAGDVIWARRQTAGRGRRGREWVSPEGNFFATLIVEAPDERNMGQLAFVAALGAAQALDGAVPVPGLIKLKWPNDILLNGKKLGGILIERSDGGEHSNLVAVGIGVNVSETELEGSSCLQDIGVETPLPRLLELICREFDNCLRQWRSDGFLPVRRAWLARAERLGEDIVVRYPDGRTDRGEFRGIDENGALELWRPDGTCETIATGEVLVPAS